MTGNGTSAVTMRSAPATAARVDWVDYAKGICIVMVVMMHSVLGVELAAGQTGFMHVLVAFAKPFRMPDFFLISGLFLSVVIDRDWRIYLDRKVVHFAYFYVLWVTIQFGFKAPGFAAESSWAHVGFLYLESFIEPFGTLWFIYLLPIFFVVIKATRKWPPLLVWTVAGAAGNRRMSTTGWTAIDEFCAALRLFLFRLSVRGLCIRAVGPRAGAARPWRLSDWRCGRSSMAAWSYLGFSEWPGVSLMLGLSGACAIIMIGHAAGPRALARLPALLRRAFHRHLSRLLPADGGDAHAAAAALASSTTSARSR